jgi:antitoxin component YwqK of YwqJK toxin-antitoxin module
LKHGSLREFDENGLLTMIIEYRNGIEVDRDIINRLKDSLKFGLWKEFYPNGKIKKEENFKQGLLHGLVKVYDLSGELLTAYRYENGDLKDTSVNIENEIDISEQYYDFRNDEGEFIKKRSGGYIEGVPIGVHRTYDSLGRVNSSRMYDRDGNLIAQGIVNEKGDKLGDWTYYYASKAIKSKGRYRNNRRIGSWIYYYENGNVEQKGLFKRGVPDDLWKWYFESGNIKREEYYRLGIEEGESIEYDEEGIIIAIGNYIEGLKEGKWKYNFYFHTEEGNYKNDFKDGFWKYSFDNGQLYFKGSFSQGNPNGKHLYYYKNGKLKEVQYYIFGRKTKNWEFYDYYGTLIKILTFEEDKLVKIDGLSVEIE